jgi:DNA polymerase III sliding clamp (beta) subunit (PCNA family)
MIVLKATQDKVLSILQSVAGIVERRHTLPILANVLLRKTGASLRLEVSEDGLVLVGANTIARADQYISSIPRTEGKALIHASHGLCGGSFSRNTRPNGFFSASKANLRNAP